MNEFIVTKGFTIKHIGELSEDGSILGKGEILTQGVRPIDDKLKLVNRYSESKCSVRGDWEGFNLKGKGIMEFAVEENIEAMSMFSTVIRYSNNRTSIANILTKYRPGTKFSARVEGSVQEGFKIVNYIRLCPGIEEDYGDYYRVEADELRLIDSVTVAINKLQEVFEV